MTLTDGGNLGIGTSSPGAKLDIGGTNNTVFFKNSGATTGYALATVSNTGGVFQYGVSSSTGTFWGSGNAGNYSVNIGTTSAVNFGFGTSDTLRMLLDSSGNLGLGVTPTTIVGASGSNGKGFQTDSVTVSSYAGVDQTYFATNAYTTSYLGGWTYRVTAAATRYDHSSGSHIWYNAASGTAGTGISWTQAMTLSGGADVSLLLGTTSAAYSVAGRGLFEVNGSSSALIAIKSGDTARGYFAAGSTATELAAVGASQPLLFTTNSAERARITSGGDFCVNTAAKVYEGLISVSFDGNGGSGDQGIALIDTNASLNGDYLLFVNSAGNVAGKITHNGTTTVAYTTSSDYRLKNTIAPITGALAKVALLKPCTYKWNVDGSDGQGFIAHELAEVVPDCVVGEKDAVDAEGKPRYQGVDTSFLVATLTAAIQELTARVAQLESK
jgi:hypothetical protein